MAKLRVTGKRFSLNGMLGITMIAVLVVAVASVIAAAVILPKYADVTEHETPDVVAIVAPDNGLISVGADPSQVFVTVKYSDGSSAQVALSELVVTGLDTRTEGIVDGVVLDFGGFKQTVSFNVVPTELQVEYIASTGGRIDGATIQNVSAGADATRVEAIPDEGYYFAGWSDGDINASRLDKQVSKSMRLVATFKKLVYSVVFYYPDGTTAREEDVEYNESPIKIPREDEHNMQMYGYRFIGWDVDYTHITKDTNIYPLYERYATDFSIECTMSPDGEAIGTTDALSFYEKDEIATVRVSPISLDYKFVGWSVYNVELNSWVNLEPEMSGGKLVHVAADYAIEFISTRSGTDNQYILSFTPDEYVDEILVKAHFVKLANDISFTSMGTKLFDVFNVGYETPIGEVFDVEDTSYLSMLGYSFKGWYAENGEVNENGSPVLVKNTTTFTQPTTLVAYWEKEIYKVVFLKGDNEDPSFVDPANGYQENVDGVLGANGKVVTAYYQDNLAGAVSGSFPEEIPVKTNYHFKGWYLADADRLPTSKVVDKTFKVESPVVYVVPVFEENTKALTVSITGSGSIYSLIENPDGAAIEKSISSRVDMPVTKDYAIRIRPTEGYTLSSVTVNGVTTSDDDLAGEDGYYDLTINAVISDDYRIDAVFTLSEYTISITNGSGATNNGTITYGILGTNVTNSQLGENVLTQVNYGAGISIEIVPENENKPNSYQYYIASVSLNGVNMQVPSEATYYNLIIENVTANQSVAITYREFAYRVTLPSNKTYGSMEAEGELLTFQRGNEPRFSITANAGYYIRRVTANGTIIDPYVSVKGYTVNKDELLVNGKEPQEGVNDYRVTSMMLSIDGIESDVTFAVEYAELYYNVTTSYEGIGSVDVPFTVGYEDSFSVRASTTSGYYVHAVVIDGGEEQTFDSVQLSREFHVGEAKKDYDVKFIFRRTSYFVRFEEKDGNTSVSYNGNTINLVSGEGYTFNEIEHASTVDFEIKVKDGYYINRINVKSNLGADYDENTNFYAKSHVVTLSNVNTSYSVVIDCLPISVEYKVYLINKAGNDVTINNESVAGNLGNASVSYGGDVNVSVAMAEGYELALANIIIKNRDTRETYQYLPLEGEYVESEFNGYYSLINSSDVLGNAVTTLFVYDVKTAIDVYVYFEGEDANATEHVLTYETEGEGTMSVTDEDGNQVASGSILSAGSEVKFALTANAGSSAKALVINGQEVSLIDGEYILTINEDAVVGAVFERIIYTINVQPGVQHGTIATQKSIVYQNESFLIRLTPNVGYYVSHFAITVEGSSVVYQPTYTVGTDYEFNGEYVTGNVTITAQFAPIQYELTYEHGANGSLSGVGSTGNIYVNYGETQSVEINANDGFYISSIVLNGEKISTTNLIGTPTATGEYVSGRLQLYVTGNIDLKVEFSPMVYSITIDKVLGGTTLVKKGSDAYRPANEVELSLGDNIALMMKADTGYHVASLKIDGVEMEGWRDTDGSINDLNQIFYLVEGGITGNVVVRVEYAVNEYQINMNVKNTSPNFSSVDVESNSYGMVTINGSAPDSSKLYRHGTNVKFVITPRTARGYYISRFELVYISDDGRETAEAISLTGNNESISESGGSYVLRGISRDIQSVNIEFKRRTYSYTQTLTIDSKDAPWISNGSLEPVFTNPYSNASVILENGKYEHGLNFTIRALPGTGYAHDTFLVNGEDRSKALRNNSYVGTINSDIDVNVKYVIQTFAVDMQASIGGEYAIYDTDGVLLWVPGITILEEAPADEDSVEGPWTLGVRQTVTGTIWATEDGIVATYGTNVVFSATPFNALNGYVEQGNRISVFKINGENKRIENEDANMRQNYEVKKDVYCEVAFTIHTYSITINTFTGGLAQISTGIVEWNQSVTIKLDINRGYVMENVKINGEDKPVIAKALADYGTYTELHVTSNLAIEITLANKKYNVTFNGDFAKTYDIVQNGEIVRKVSAVSGVIVNKNVNGKTYGEYFTNVAGNFSDVGQLLGDAVFADKLTISLTAPNGYKITSVSITMDNDGGVVSSLVQNESGLDADDGTGTRTFTIPSMTGNVVINITYAIKQYAIEYVTVSGGQYESTGITLVSHHELFELKLVSNAGYYLASLDVNGISIPTVYEKDGMRYKYNTTTKALSGGEKKLEINDAFVNGQSKITILPTYEKQKFDVVFFVNNQQITDQFTDKTLGLSLENDQLIFDAENVIGHELKEGYSITNISFYNMLKNNPLAVAYNFALEGTAGRDYNLFTSKGASLDVTLDDAILSMMDYHSVSHKVVYVYYTTAIDEHETTLQTYLVEATVENERVINKGSAIEPQQIPTVGGTRAFTVVASFSDNKSIMRHVYGTEAVLTVNVPASGARRYSFQGFQEYKNGVWSYVTHDPNGSGITLQSNGQVLRYNMTSDRTFRAVFFRVYEITVQIHPEYKYFEGSFANNDPSNMKYRQYAGLTATANYSQNSDRGVILPNVEGTQEILEDTDGNADATYTYRVLSGARLVLRGRDSISKNETKGYSYCVINEVNGTISQREDSYTAGVETLEERLVYAYFKNTMMVSFAMETVGSKVNSEGGTVTYEVDGATVGGLTNNSLSMSPNQTLTVNITPKESFRFDSILELLPLSVPDAQGFKQFSSIYTPITEKADGSVTMVYYDAEFAPISKISEYTGRISRVSVTFNNLAENTIFKIRFWKQISVTTRVEWFTDEPDSSDFSTGYDIWFNDRSSGYADLANEAESFTDANNNGKYDLGESYVDSNNNGRWDDSKYAKQTNTYDYNDRLFYDIGMTITNLVGYKKYYQFVGYFINGINAYTQLGQNYPATYEGDFILNDLDGLPNGVNIVERTTSTDGVQKTTYDVEIVAKFIPVYNIVIENEYIDSGSYLNPGQITASTIVYDESLTQYFTSSYSIESRLGSDNSYRTDTVFQMLGKINTIDNTNKNHAGSSYNTWNDNMLTLSWIGGAESSDSFSFIAWQYYAYNETSRTYEWRNIPYVDPNSQTNLVTKGTFTFPISCLFSTAYPAYVNKNDGVINGFTYDASKYDYNGNWVSSTNISAIRIRPLFQKVENLTLVKSTALSQDTIFIDGQGEAEPKINSTSRSNGYFNYNTVQTLLHGEIPGYVFEGWYITENGNGGYQRLSAIANEGSYDKAVVEGSGINATTYYLKTEEIKNVLGEGTGEYISYNYNPLTKQMQVLMDASFKIFARYVRVYTLSIRVSNVSGFSQVLTDAMPTLNCYQNIDGVWTLLGEVSGNRMITIDNARVGTQYKFTLSTNYTQKINDSTYFNPLYDRFAGITSVNENNQNVWDGNNSTDAINSSIPKAGDLRELILAKEWDEYNATIEAMEIIVTANAEKTVNVNFESYGTLVIHNVYVGSAIKLPNELGEILKENDPTSVEESADAAGNTAYYVNDGGVGDVDNVVDGIITINGIPISSGRTFDGQISGDYANRIIESMKVLDSDNISLGINFDGSKITKKVQHVVYYGQASWNEYDYVYNGIWDDGEEYEDLNGNATWDPAEPLVDLNGNGVWDLGEVYTDTNGNSTWDQAEPLVDVKRFTAIPYNTTSIYDYPFDGGDDVATAGDGSEANPFKIRTVEHLRNVDNLYKGNNANLIYGYSNGEALRIHFKQVADINLNEVNNTLDRPLCMPFTANGVYYSNGFNGVYDGGNFALYNAQLDLRSSGIKENVGIFSRVYRGGVVKNVAIGRAYVAANANNVGVIAGSVFGGTIENVYYVEKGSPSISNSVNGANFVGGLVGLLSGESVEYGVINNSSIASFNIIATKGGSYLGQGSDYTGGAGGIVGSIGNYGRLQGKNGGYTVKSVSIVNGSAVDAQGIGAGGVVGTIQASIDTSGPVAVENVTAIDTRLASTYNKIAVGGIVGAVGANRKVIDAEFILNDSDSEIRSYSSPSGFTAPTWDENGNVKNYGGGGIAGYNNGTISNASVTTTGNYTLTLTGSMVGGLVGVNFGTVEGSSVKARLYTSRQMGTAYEGGTYGGMVGFNAGSLLSSGISGINTATDDYNRATAAYEIVTAGNREYVPTSGGNGQMHGDAGADTATIYAGGAVGYNIGTVNTVSVNAKLMVNRRSNDTLTSESFIAAVCGYSSNDNVTTLSGNAYVKFFHYLWVDQANDVNLPMYVYIGEAKGNGISSDKNINVIASAEYVGGGTKYDPASIEAGFTWGFEGTNYLSGTANVYFYDTNGYTASSYAPDWNVSGTTEAGSESGKVYATDCQSVGPNLQTLWKTAWNYQGSLRYVNVSLQKV